MPEHSGHAARAGLAVLLCAAGSSAAALRTGATALLVRNDAAFERTCEPVTFGLPFTRGQIEDLAALGLFTGRGGALPLQALLRERYGDSSIRWALCDTQITVGPSQTARLELRRRAKSVSSAPRLKYGLEAEGAWVQTGTARFRIGLKPFQVFSGVEVEGRELLQAALLSVRTSSGTHLAVDPPSVRASFEDEGPLRAVLCVRGNLRNEKRGRTEAYVVFRYHFFAGKSFVHLYVTVGNPHRHRHPGNIWDLGSGGSLFVEDVSLLVALREGTADTALVPCGTGRIFKDTGTEVTLYQDSSGGPHWRSFNHVTKDYTVPMRFCGWRLYRQDRVVASGRRIDGWIHLQGKGGGAGVAVKHFWQNFPKALSVRGRRLRVGLWPAEWAVPHEILGGEQKTHQLCLFFHGAGVSEKEVKKHYASFNSPLVVMPDPKHIVRTGVFGPSATLDRARYRRLETTCDAAFTPLGPGATTIPAKWERIDEYGWRHFGDTFADNERAPARMVKDFPAYHIGSMPIGHYVNEYGVIKAVMHHGLRRADPRWLSFADAMARHHADICVYHTSEDVPAYSHGPFMHTTHETAAYRSTFRSYPIEAKRYGLRYGQGGGPNAGHTYVDCLAYHFLLTGNRTSLESFLEVASWAAHSPWFSPRMMGDRRGYGNFLRTFVHAYRLTGDRTYYRNAVTIMDWVGEPFVGLGGTLLALALGDFLQLKVDRGEYDEDFRRAQSLLCAFGRRYLRAPAAAYERFLEQRCFHSAVLLSAYLWADSSCADREDFRRKGQAIVQQALERFPARYVPVKTWVMCFSATGPFLKVNSSARMKGGSE